MTVGGVTALTLLLALASFGVFVYAGAWIRAVARWLNP